MPKTPLKKRIANPRSGYWKKKCWALCREMWAGECAIHDCHITKQINLHHLLDKKMYGECYFDHANLLPLCPSHHKLGRFAAHTNPLWFIRWLEEHEPMRIAWMHCAMLLPKVPIKERLTHKETYYKLLAMKEQRNMILTVAEAVSRKEDEIFLEGISNAT